MKINESMKSFLSFEKINTDEKATEKKSAKKDTIEISDTSRAFNKLNDFLNLGKPGRMDVSDLSPGEKEEFLKMLAALLKKGIIGYEVREVDGKPEKHYIVNQIGNKRLYGTELYDEEAERLFRPSVK